MAKKTWAYAKNEQDEFIQDKMIHLDFELSIFGKY